MRQLHPICVDEIDPATAYAADDRPAPPGRPWIMANMVSSVDGATAIAGLSGGLGGPGDKAVFATVRSLADVVLVAAGTVRAERYGPVRLSEQHRSAREARGQRPVPRLAIVTARLDLDLDSELFGESPVRPIIFTVESASAERRDAAAEVAEVVVLGETSVDLVGAMRWLAEHAGASIVLCEGGPSLIGAIAACGALDELCWTISNTMVVGDSTRLAHGPTLQPPLTMRLRRILELDGTLFTRYVRA